MYVCITDDEESVIGKLKQVAIDRLKEEGVEIDSEDPEKTKKSIIQRAKAYFGVSRKSSTTLAVFLITFFFGLIDTNWAKYCVSYWSFWGVFSAADMDDGEFRQMVLKDLLINLQQKGFDIDPGIESYQILPYNIQRR